MGQAANRKGADAFAANVLPVVRQMWLRGQRRIPLPLPGRNCSSRMPCTKSSLAASARLVGCRATLHIRR